MSGGELVRRLIRSGLRVRARDRVTAVQALSVRAASATFVSISVEQTTVTVTH